MRITKQFTQSNSDAITELKKTILLSIVLHLQTPVTPAQIVVSVSAEHKEVPVPQRNPRSSTLFFTY